jgi:hypothetical protein
MKFFLSALCTAVAVMTGAASIATSADLSDGPLRRIAGIVLRIDGVHVEDVDDALVVVDDRTGRPICILTCEQEGVVSIVGSGVHDSVGGDTIAVDMSYLDVADVGVLVVDPSRRIWTLTHRFDPRRVTPFEVEELIARFMAAVRATRLRFEREVSLGRYGQWEVPVDSARIRALLRTMELELVAFHNGAMVRPVGLGRKASSLADIVD